MESYSRLVDAAQQGDDHAFGQLVKHFQDMAYYTAYRYLENSQQAQDVAQNAFIEAYHCLSSLREPAAFPGWLQRIIFKQCDRQVRGIRPVLVDLDDRPDLAMAQPGPEQALEHMERRETVHAAIHSLPPIYREVIVRFYLRRQSYREIAVSLDLPLSTIKKRLYTGRQQLKERISPMSTTTTYKPSQDDTFANRVKFYTALRNNDLIQVRQLASRSPDLITAKTEWGVASYSWYWPLGMSALHWAAGVGNRPLAALLVELGAEIDVRDQAGNTPLKRAAHMGQEELARWLLENGADVDAVADNGQTALHVAVIRNRPEVVDTLLAHGADTTLQDQNGHTPLDWAQKKHRPDVARLLGGIADEADFAFAHPAKGEMWPTGIKIVDLLAPLCWGGRNGLFTLLSGIGIDVMLGELMQVMATRYGGTTLLLSLEKGDFTQASRELQWRNYGVADYGTAMMVGQNASPGRQLHLAERGIAQAQKMAADRPVLLVVYTNLARQDGVLPILNRAMDIPNLTTLFIGAETMEALPPKLADLDSALTFSLARGRAGLWPAIDPLRSRSSHYAHEKHQRLAEEAVRHFRRHDDMVPIVENQGVEALTSVFLVGDEPAVYHRARLLHHFLTQPLFVAEPWTARPGVFVPLADTLKTTQAILNGDLDEHNEEELIFTSDWSPKWT